MKEEEWLESLKQGRILPESDLICLCERAKEIFIEENNVQNVQSPVVICEDIRGQFFDLLSIFSIVGEIPYRKFIFMGNLIDYGYGSVEVVELLLTLKVIYLSLIHI